MRSAKNMEPPSVQYTYLYLSLLMAQKR